MVAASALALEALGVVGSLRGDLKAAGEELAGLRERIRASVPFSNNRAKQAASTLRGRFPAVYSLARMSSVARRFKNQLAENSKVPAKYGLLPEAGHNEVEAFPRGNRLLLPVFIRDWEETVQEKGQVDAFKATIGKTSGTRPLDVRVKAGTRLGRLLAPILFLDYVTVYLAILTAVDPTPTPRILEYRHRSSRLA
jgi:glucose/mannose-6-phosphate isomerase